MKNARLLVIMSLAALIGLSSCEESADLSNTTFEGTYRGSLTYESSLKSSPIASNGISEATAEISDLGGGQMEVHCFGDEMDTTFILNWYEHYNMIMVCLDGVAFERMYGHMMGGCPMMGGGHMNNTQNQSGSMMDGHNNGNTDWMDHMNREHRKGDEHFGWINMTDHTFEYTIKAGNGDYHFIGKK
jgi:hypothetical protein